MTLTKEAKFYAIENLLVIVMIGSAVALQIIKRRHRDGEGPLLLRALESVSDEVMPWPLSLIAELMAKE